MLVAYCSISLGSNANVMLVACCFIVNCNYNSVKLSKKKPRRFDRVKDTCKTLLKVKDTKYNK